MSGLSFTGKVVLVTGATSAVGSELAKYFSKLGASLVLTGCDKYLLNKIGDECPGGPVLKIAADLTKNEDVTGVIKQTIAEFKKLDVLINYVGPMDCFTTDDLTNPDAFQFMMNVSVCSVYCLTQLAHPHLIKTRGNVINVHGLLSPSTSNFVSCNVARSALDELTRSLASQYSRKGVRVNTVSTVSTENRPGNSGKPTEKSSELQTHPRPEDVAAAAVFLASDLASFIVGANLPVDGGKHLTSLKEVLDNAVESNHEKSAGGDARSNVPKSESCQHDSRKKEQSHIDGSDVDHSKRDMQKNESGKQTPAKHDTRKSEVDKSTAVKSQSSEKMSKTAIKNNN